MPHPSQEPHAQREGAGRFAPLRVTALILLLLLAVTYLIAIPVGLVGKAQRLATPEIILAAVLIISLALIAQSEYAITD